MASEIWAKFYVEMNHDPKVGRLSDRLYRRMCELFLFAKETDLEGMLPPVDDMAWTLHTSEKELLDEMEALAAPGIEILTMDEAGNWFVSKFTERQAPDSTAQRVRRHRETKLKRNVTGTLQDQKRTTPENETLKEREKEKEKEIDQEKEGERESSRAESSEKEDPFDILQEAIESVIGLPQGADAVKTINELVKLGAEAVDIRDAAGWYRSQNKTIRSASQLLGPAKTAILKRKQAKNQYARDPAGGVDQVGVLSGIDKLMQEANHV